MIMYMDLMIKVLVPTLELRVKVPPPLLQFHFCPGKSVSDGSEMWARDINIGLNNVKLAWPFMPVPLSSLLTGPHVLLVISLTMSP